LLYMFIGKHIFVIFLSLFVIRNFRSVVLKVSESHPWGDFEDKEAIKPKGEIGGKQKKRGKNVQPLINR